MTDSNRSTDGQSLLDFLRDPKRMEDWDSWRRYIAAGGTSSWPRDAFESLLGLVIEELEARSPGGASDEQCKALDREYYYGARQAAAMAHQSLEAMDAWIQGGCGNRVPSMVQPRREVPGAQSSVTRSAEAEMLGSEVVAGSGLPGSPAAHLPPEPSETLREGVDRIRKEIKEEGILDAAVLREYLRIYGGHIPPCTGRPCECGFAKAWEVAKLPNVQSVDVAALNRELCEKEGHALGVACRPCLRCGAHFAPEPCGKRCACGRHEWPDDAAYIVDSLARQHGRDECECPPLTKDEKHGP